MEPAAAKLSDDWGTVMDTDKDLFETLRSYIDGESEDNFAHWDQRIISGWIVDAREWLEQLTGDGTISSRQAFEGITCLCHLHRSHPEIVIAFQGDGDLHKLKCRLTGDNSAEVAALALSYPYMFEWKPLVAQLENIIFDTWDSTVSTAISLLDWLDGIECVCWFAEHHKILPEQLSELSQQHWQQLCGQIDECRFWIVNNAECFLETDFYVERFCHTFRADLESQEIDPSGCFAITVLRYITLLAEMNELQPQDGPSVTSVTRHSASMEHDNAVARLPEETNSAQLATTPMMQKTTELLQKGNRTFKNTITYSLVVTAVVVALLIGGKFYRHFWSHQTRYSELQCTFIGLSERGNPEGHGKPPEIEVTSQLGGYLSMVSVQTDEEVLKISFENSFKGESIKLTAQQTVKVELAMPDPSVIVIAVITPKPLSQDVIRREFQESGRPATSDPKEIRQRIEDALQPLGFDEVEIGVLMQTPSTSTKKAPK